MFVFVKKNRLLLDFFFHITFITFVQSNRSREENNDLNDRDVKEKYCRHLQSKTTTTKNVKER